MGDYASFLPLVAIALLFWLMVIRPQSRRQKALAQMQSDLAPGDRVMLASGIYGTVRSLTEDRVHVEVAPGVEIEVVRAAIGSIDRPEERTEVIEDPETRDGEV